MISFHAFYRIQAGNSLILPVKMAHLTANNNKNIQISMGARNRIKWRYLPIKQSNALPLRKKIHLKIPILFYGSLNFFIIRVIRKIQSNYAQFWAFFFLLLCSIFWNRFHCVGLFESMLFSHNNAMSFVLVY